MHCEQLALSAVAAEHDTPCYVYSQAALRSAWESYRQALGDTPATICYAVKANGNVNLLRLLAEWGSGFDIVSGGELERVRCAGADMAKVVFSGVGKTAPEIKRALQLGVRALHVESAPELDLIGDIAAGMGVVASVCMRVNPDLSVDTHDYISTARADNKFGVPAAEALELYARSARHRHLRPVGLSAHLGSQIFAPTAFQSLLSFLLDLLQRLRAQGIELEYLDIGGGLGVDYQGDKEQLQPRDLLHALAPLLAENSVELILEPGRSLVAASAVLLTRVLYSKRAGNTHYAIVDAAMNDLLRPALYQAWHDVRPVSLAAPGDERDRYNIVGPICESGDFLALDRDLPRLQSGDLLAISHCGAYASSMASNYNSRNRACELLVDGADARVIRRRESYSDQMHLELP